MYLVLRRGAPVRYARGVCDALLQPVGTEGAESDGSSAVETADCPEWGRHCVVWARGGLGRYMELDEVGGGARTLKLELELGPSAGSLTIVNRQSRLSTSYHPRTELSCKFMSCR